MSDYMDFWCIDKRKRMHNIIMYILIIALLFVFSNVMIYLYINGTYKAIEDSKIEVENPNITIEQAKATYVNGYVNGKIKNNTEETINEKYIKFEFSTLRDVNIGNKYLKIENLEPGQEIEYKVNFKYQDIKKMKISEATAEEVKNATESEFEITEEMKLAAAYAIADIINQEELNENYIIPDVFDERVMDRVAQAVKSAKK